MVGLEEIVISRQILQDFAHASAELPTDLYTQIATFALEKIKPKVRPRRPP